MSKFEKLLKEFEQLLINLNYKNYNKLIKPLDLSKIEEYFKVLNIEDKDLLSLYSWKNGWDSRLPGYCSLMDFGCFLSLESVLSEMEYNLEHSFWSESYIPIINDLCGSHILYNCQAGAEYGKLYLHSPSLMFVEPVTYYDSVFSMIETTIAAYNENVFFYDEDADWLDIDIPEFRKIGKRINKMSAYWSIEKHES